MDVNFWYLVFTFVSHQDYHRRHTTSTTTENRKENNDNNNKMNDQQPPQAEAKTKTKKELEFERIGLQAREFWEEEERLIAAEKETETRRIIAEKELERERIAAQAHSLEKQKQQQEEQQWENDYNNGIKKNISPSSIASPGMVARRAEWLKKREEEANARRRREEENNNSLTPRKQQPNTSTTAGNTTTTTSDDDDDNEDKIISHDHDHNHNHNCDFEEGLEKLRDQTTRIDSIVENAERKVLQSSEELDEEFQNIQDELEEAERNLRNKSSDSSCEIDIATPAQNNIDNNILHNNSQEGVNIIIDEEEVVSPRALMDEFCSPDDVAEENIDASSVLANPTPEMKETTTTTATTQQQLKVQSQSKTHDVELEEKAVNNIIEPAIIIQQPLIVQSHPTVQQYGAEIDPRTQAMVSEDDIMKPSNSDNHDVSSGPGFNKFYTARKNNNLALNSFPNQKSRRSRKSSNLNDDDEDESKIEFVHKAATFEIPVEVTNNGLKLSPKVADLTMITTIPPSRVGGRISGVLKATSSLGESNTASGSATIEYKSSKYSRLTLGMIRGFEPCYPLISVGGQILRYGSSFGITYYQNANNILHRFILDHSVWSLSFRHRFSDSKWCFSSQLSRRQDLSLSLTNNKLSGLFGWNLLKPNKLHIRFDARPKLSEYRRAHLYCQWKSGVWNFGISLVQSLHSQIATVGLGWRLFSTRGLEWVITWTRGNAVIRIPIVVSKGLAANATIGQTMYFSVISYIIQQYTAEMWGWIVIGDDNDVSDEADAPMAVVQAQNLTMARRDAAIQKELMARQASRKTKNEAERDGLIIKDAIYSIRNGDEWNVTIPLQFWVSNSTLKLPARRKSELLGFYDIVTSMKNNSTLSVNSSNRRRRKSSWSDVWNDLFDWTPKDVLLRRKAAAELPSPTLTVSYEFKNQSYQITVKDSEELRLPHLV